MAKPAGIAARSAPGPIQREILADQERERSRDAVIRSRTGLHSDIFHRFTDLPLVYET